MNKYLGEFIGTFGLVFAGTGSIIINDLRGGVITHVGIAITFGLIVMAMIYSVGDISGAHLNPAVTIGFWLAKRLPSRVVPGFIGSQFAGGISASLILKLIFPNQESLGGTIPTIPIPAAFAMEVILTFFLMFVIIHVAVGAKEVGLMAGVAIGATVALSALFAGPVTGASMNPVRSLAPALVSWRWDHQWIYVVAPLIGSAMAVGTCKVMRKGGCCTTELSRSS